MKKISLALVAMILIINGCTSTIKTETKVNTNSTTTPSKESAVKQESNINQTSESDKPQNLPAETNKLIEQSESTETKISIKTSTTPVVKEFNLTAKRFAFSPSTITVNKGDKVKIIINSLDVNHGFTIAEYDIHETIEPGKQTTVEFTADQVGTFSFYCSTFCGSGHSEMKGSLIVK